MRKPGTSANLTAPQVMGYLQSYIAHYGYPPSQNDIAKHFGVSKMTASYWINRLDDKGFIERPAPSGGGLFERGTRPSRAIKILKRIEGYEYELG